MQAALLAKASSSRSCAFWYSSRPAATMNGREGGSAMGSFDRVWMRATSIGLWITRTLDEDRPKVSFRPSAMSAELASTQSAVR